MEPGALRWIYCRIHFFVEGDGTVIFMPAKSEVRELKRILPKPRNPISIEAMKAAIVEGGSFDKKASTSVGYQLLG